MSVIPTKDTSLPAMRTAGPAAHKPAHAPAGLTGQDLIRILRRRMWLIILFVVGFTVSATVVTYFWRAYAPQYSAVAWLEVNAPKNNVLENPALATQEVMDRQVLQLAKLIMRESVLDKAVKDKRFTDTTWYQKYRSDPTRQLQKELEVLPIAKTNLIQIVMSGRNIADLPEMVNAVADAAVSESRDTFGNERMNERKQLESEIAAQEQALTQSRKEDAAILNERDVTSLQNQNAMLSIRLTSLVPKLDVERGEMATAKMFLDDLQAKAAQPGMLETNPYVQQKVDFDHILNGMMTTEKNLALQLDQLSKKYGDHHVYLQQAQAQLAMLRKNIKDTTNVVVANAVQDLLSAADQRWQEAQKKFETDERELQSLQASARDVSANLTRHEQLVTDQKNLVDRIEKLNTRSQELGMAVRMAPPASLRSYAPRPKEPSFPMYVMFIPLGVALGLMFGLGLAFLLEMLDTSIKSPSDVARRVNLPLLGMLPHTDDMDEEIEDARTAFASHPNSLISEAFRQIRACLLFSGTPEHRRSLLITSPMPEDGRTTIAMNLAATIARGGRSVIVIDANFRQPMIHKMFKQTPQAGLSSVLTGQAKWQDQTYNVESGLAVMGAGPLPPNPAELLGSDPMRQLLNDLAGKFDQIIFDGPPCLVVSDAAILGAMVDGVIMTIRAGTNTYGIAQRSRDTISRVGGKILGVVLNGVRVTAGGYLQKNYETYYDYHSQGQESDKSQLPLT
jgi:succinoglycan biosynthesis transport protein ExoP